MSSDAQRRLSEEEYLALERTSSEKHEYVKGELFLMSGATYNHVTITMNLSWLLRNALVGKACRVLAMDMRVKAEMTRNYFYPDLIGFCGEPEFADNRQDTLLNPCLLVEVLSPSTRGYDKERKFQSYRRIPSLVDYVLVESGHTFVEHYTRNERGVWELSDREAGAMLRLPSVDAEIPIDAIYADVIR